MIYINKNCNKLFNNYFIIFLKFCKIMVIIIEKISKLYF